MKKLKGLIRNIGSIILEECMKYEAALDEIARTGEAENQLAAVTSGGFVRVISPVLKELCYMSPEPVTESYIRHLETATEMILEGNEQAEVIAYYDNKLEVKKRGKQGEERTMLQVFDELRAVLTKHKENIPVIVAAEMLAVIDGTEAKQLPDIVRCKDCKFQQCNIYTEGYYCGRGVFPNNRNYVTEDDFCSLAEKR